MKTSCNIIKDLLPLYVDNVCSKETEQLINEHLLKCEGCRETLENMKEKINVSSIDEKKAIKNFSKKIKRKKFFAVILAVVITLVLVIGGVKLWNKEDFVRKYEENLITVEEQKDGELVANINAINFTSPQLILEQNADNTVDIYITLFQSLKDKSYPTKEEKTSIGCLNKCWGNFIDENIEFYCVWEDNKDKIIFRTHNDVKIANIYYLETMEEFKTVKHSEDISDRDFEMIKVWKNNNVPFVFKGSWGPSDISTIDIERVGALKEGETIRKATIKKEDVYHDSEESSPMLDMINILNNVNFGEKTGNRKADYEIKINTPEKENVFKYELEVNGSGYYITAVIGGKTKEAVLSPTYQEWMDGIIRCYFNK